MQTLLRKKMVYPFWVVLLIGITTCNSGNKEKLPFIGPKEVVSKEGNGKATKDTIYHKVPDFRFIDQDSQVVTQKTFENKVYVADFFFTSCPTICPKMTEQMYRVYKEYKDNPKVMFLSHTVDPKRDTPGTLKNYANKLGVDSTRWKFVTGHKDSIYRIGKKGYMASAKKDSAAPGGFLHSGQFFLVDEKRRIRGIYRGTKTESVDDLMSDLDQLLR